MGIKKIRFILKAYDSKILVQACDQLIAAIEQSADMGPLLDVGDRSLENVEELELGGNKLFDTLGGSGPNSLDSSFGLQRIIGPVPLPTRRRIYCVLRSPHVNKDSREHFEIRIHKRLIDVLFPRSIMIARLNELDLPSGIGLQVKTLDGGINFPS